jgi:hypothetical protein
MVWGKERGEREKAYKYSRYMPLNAIKYHANLMVVSMNESMTTLRGFRTVGRPLLRLTAAEKMKQYNVVHKLVHDKIKHMPEDCCKLQHEKWLWRLENDNKICLVLGLHCSLDALCPVL